MKPLLLLSNVLSVGCLLLLCQIPIYAQAYGGDVLQTQSEDLLMTVLEARVEQDGWDLLREAFHASGAELPSQIAESFLVQSSSDSLLWRVVTIWRCRQALEEYKNSTEIPEGVLMFRAAGAEPTLSIFDVAERLSNGR